MPRKFVCSSRHVVCRLSGPLPSKTISEPLVRVTFIGLSSQFQTSAAVKKKNKVELSNQHVEFVPQLADLNNVVKRKKNR